ncbi:hypothetical protein RchiOBHm_Chr4g0421581 [Rosa chinensis]|uniref:Uncharacterized protein n=1 Tax=Rosa chinensis TaxID=74649 RepID=A0A2P6QY47_ROSCH|nr:hypothetical protein RchiOBHm_Chr4g0421581 [Rosa chinensis]
MMPESEVQIEDALEVQIGGPNRSMTLRRLFFLRLLDLDTWRLGCFGVADWRRISSSVAARSRSCWIGVGITNVKSVLEMQK